MHSRIFQIEEAPIDVDDYINEYTFEESGFVGSVADYVDESRDRPDDIDWLISYIGKYGAVYNKKKESIVFNKGFKENYFRQKYDQFHTYVSKITFEDFVNDSYVPYKLKTLIEETGGFYVYNCGWETLDSFIRDMTEGKEYYIGGTVDYHR
jgi:hypothetical protein